MIKLKFDRNNDCIDLMRDKHTVTCLNTDEFRELINEIKRMIEQVSPKLAKKNAEMANRRKFVNGVKMYFAIHLIDLARFVTAIITKVKQKLKRK